MSKTGNNIEAPISYAESLYRQIKKYEDSISISPLVPYSFQEIDIDTNTDVTSLVKDSFIGSSSGNMLDVVMSKIKKIESLQAVKINHTPKKDEIAEEKTAMADLVYKYAESLNIEEIKAAVRSNKFF